MEQAVISLPERIDERSVHAMLAQLETIADASVVVIEGAPGRFCLGMDFAIIPRTGTMHAEGLRLRQGLRAFARCLERLLVSPRPTLAVVDGPALGGGLGLAAACDFVLATERACFGLPEALYGLAPAIIRPALITRLSLQRLNLLLFTCHTRSADAAAGLGLVDRVVPLQRLASARNEIVRQLHRARTETVVASRRWSADDVKLQLRAGIKQTAAALSDRRILASVRAGASEEDIPWRC